MINKEEFKKIEKLAKIEFVNEDERDSCIKKISSIMKLIYQLQDIDYEGIEPLQSVCHDYQRMQEDQVEISNTTEDLFKNIPANGAEIAKEVKCFTVPKVIE